MTLLLWRPEVGGALPGYVHPMPAEADDLAAAAALYAQTWEEVHADAPCDVALIGIGEDGHFASLFPNHPGLQELDTVFVCNDSPKPPADRLSLSLPVVAQIPHRFVVVLGEEKGQVAARAQQGPNPELPISLLPAKELYWYCDDVAVAAWQAAR